VIFLAVQSFTGCLESEYVVGVAMDKYWKDGPESVYLENLLIEHVFCNGHGFDFRDLW